MTYEPLATSATPRTKPVEPIELDDFPDTFEDDDFEADGRFHDLDGEGFDLSDRQALRRVSGLTTELQDVTEVEYRQLRLEQVVLVGVWTTGTLIDAENSLFELARLAETAGSNVLEGLIQRRERPDPATYIGSGKAKQLRDIVTARGA